jgi:ABC-type ATPase with predicted acetyltransferase domain
VVHPEFRGLGIGAAIARHLTVFADKHWDINGYKPILIEVIASMTDYHRFFEYAGFVEAGRTKGTSRVFRPKYGNGSFESRPNSQNYKFFSPLGPKPYLVYPLGIEMTTLLREKKLIADEQIRVSRPPATLRKSIKVTNTSVSYRTKNIVTPRAKEIGTVFGLNGSQLRFPVLNRFNCEILPGDVVLVAGASGSGKSTLIRLLTTPLEALKKTLNIEGTRIVPRREKIAVLNETNRSRKPLIEIVGKSLGESVALLNTAGLAEAHLYLKTPDQLSEGQRYRFAIAELCDSGKPLWVADEFASKLDPITAAIVAKGLRKLAYSQGATLVLAAPHIEHFVESLCPTQIIQLSWGGKALAFAARICLKVEKGRVRLWVINRSLSPLTAVRIVVTNTFGGSRMLLKPSDLGPRSSGPVVDLPVSAFRAGDVLRVSSNEGVGDVLFVSGKDRQDL